VVELKDVEWIYNYFTDVAARPELLTEWVIKLMHDEGASFSDMHHIEEGARFYFEVKSTPKFKRIVNEYNQDNEKNLNPKNILDFSLQDLQNIEDIYKLPEMDPRVRKLNKRLPPGASLVYNDGTYQIVEVTEASAACTLGAGTRWCTKEEDVAEGDYLNEANLYIIYVNGKRTYQLFVPPGDERIIQLMGERNNPITPDENVSKLLWDAGFLKEILNILNKMGGRILHNYRIVNRWMKFAPKEAVNYIARLPYLATAYAEWVLGHPWPEAEPAIATSAETALRYVTNVIRRRFPEGEKAIFDSWVSDYKMRYLATLQNFDPTGYEAFHKDRAEQAGLRPDEILY
jgi:hypothetical protein